MNGEEGYCPPIHAAMAYVDARYKGKIVRKSGHFRASLKPQVVRGVHYSRSGLRNRLARTNDKSRSAFSRLVSSSSRNCIHFVCGNLYRCSGKRLGCTNLLNQTWQKNRRARQTGQSSRLMSTPSLPSPDSPFHARELLRGPRPGRRRRAQL